MTRPSVLIITGLCCIVTIAFAVRQLRGPDPNGPEGGPPAEMVASAKAISERGGWGTQEGKPGATRSDGRDQAAAKRGSGSTGSGQRGGLAEAIGSADRQAGSLGHSGSGRLDSGGNSIRLSAIPKSSAGSDRGSRLFEDFDHLSAVGGLPQEPALDEEEDETDENGPVLSLPLDGSLEPEKGEAPILAEGVTFENEFGARFSTDARFAVPNAGSLTGEAGTIAFTVQPEWQGGEDSDASLVQLRTPNQWENRIQITKNGRYLRFLFTDNTGAESGAGYVIDNWQPGQTYDVRATWGDGIASLYVNGRRVGQGNYSGEFIPPGGPIYIGSDHPGGQPGAQAVLSNVQLYNRVVVPE